VPDGYVFVITVLFGYRRADGVHGSGHSQAMNARKPEHGLFGFWFLVFVFRHFCVFRELQGPHCAPSLQAKGDKKGKGERAKKKFSFPS
jgi:hypothetical protein